MNKLILILLIPTSLLFPVEPIFNLHSFYTVSALDFSNSSSCLTELQIIKPDGDRAYYLNPKAKLYINKCLDLSISSGIRKSFGTEVLGVHVFLSHSINPYVNFFQTGMSFEYLSREVDLRLNTYIPFPEKLKKRELLWVSHKWNELEISRHFKNFSITASGLYDSNKNAPAARLKFTVPYENMSLVCGIHCNNFKRLIPFISLCFNFSSLSSQNECKPISYAQRVWCHATGETFYGSLQETPQEEEKEEIDEGETNILPETEEVVPEQTQPQPTQKPEHLWWSLF